MPVKFYKIFAEVEVAVIISYSVFVYFLYSAYTHIHTLITFWFGLDVISTALCQKGLSDIFCHFVLFMDYDTTANNTSVKFLEASCAWK